MRRCAPRLVARQSLVANGQIAGRAQRWQQRATNASTRFRQGGSQFDNGTKVVTCTGTCSDLHGPGAVDKNASTALAFRSASSPIKGTGTFSDIQAADLVGDKLYANIHTAATAELRGPMAMQVPVLFLIPGDVVPWRRPALGGRAGQKSQDRLSKEDADDAAGRLLQNLHGCEAVIWDQHLCKLESSCDCDYEAAGRSNPTWQQKGQEKAKQAVNAEALNNNDPVGLGMADDHGPS